MKKISTKIILIVLICSISMATIVGVTSISRSMRVIQAGAKENLLDKAEIYSESINNELIIYEAVNKSISQLADAIINVSNLGEEGYLENYIDNVLDPMIRRSVNDLKDCAGISVAFDHKFTGKTEGAWWVVAENGQIKRLAQTNLAGKDANDPAFKWYYDAFKTKTEIWSDPYVNDIGLSVVTYSAPIVINSIPIGVVSIDLNISGMAEKIESIKLHDTGYAF